LYKQKQLNSAKEYDVMAKFLLSFNHLGYCIHIDPILDNTDVPRLIRERQNLEPDDDYDLAYGFWDIQEGDLEQFEDAAKIRNCALAMMDGCDCVCGGHIISSF